MLTFALTFGALLVAALTTLVAAITIMHYSRGKSFFSGKGGIVGWGLVASVVFAAVGALVLLAAYAEPAAQANGSNARPTSKQQFSPEESARLTRLARVRTSPNLLVPTEIPTRVSVQYPVRGNKKGPPQGTPANMALLEPVSKWVTMTLDDYHSSFWVWVNGEERRASEPGNLRFRGTEVEGWSMIIVAFQAMVNHAQDAFATMTVEYGDESDPSKRLRFADEVTVGSGRAGVASYRFIPDPAAYLVTLHVTIKYPATETVPAEKHYLPMEAGGLALDLPVTLRLFGDNGAVVEKKLYAAETEILPIELEGSSLAGATAAEVTVGIPALPQGVRVEVVRLVQPR